MDESEIPIDIHTNKLLDWLISRRHVPRDWQTKVISIREKINEAIKDMPADEGITALLSGSYINYYHCQRIVDILKETESSSKNLFGQYGSKRMKDWVEIIKLYEKDNIYLGEVASLLLRNVNYEVPALRKQIARTIHLSNEYDKKETEYEKSANFIKNEFSASCKSLGIKGERIKEELIGKAADFPLMNQKLAEETKQLKQSVEFYQKAVNSLLDPQKTVLEMVKEVMEKGDITVYEWKYKKAPSKIETVNITVVSDETTPEEDVIDFGADIELDVDENIDWGISTEDTETASTEVDDSIASGEDARTILGHPSTRKEFTNGILELEAFLKLRVYEMNSKTDGLTLSMLPESLQIYDENLVQEMLHKVKTVLRSLTDTTSIHYLNITTNPRYVDQLAEKLKQKMSTYEKMQASRDCVRTQRSEVIKEGESLRPKVDVLIEKTKELQDLIEKDISKKYHGRPVNLMGGVNTL